MLATTINMHIDIFNKICQVSEKLNISKREIVVMLLMRSMEDIHILRRGFTTVKYQPDDEKDNWYCFAIRFRPDEFEYFCDLRKIGKYSVSYLVAIAVDRYIDELIEKVKNVVYNYPKYSSYVLYREVVEDVICWQCYWGFPIKRLKTLKI